MKINDDHMFHGAALTQIAEHELFTSINAVRISKKLSRSSFRINESIGMFVKYAAEPKGTDYNFTFSKENKKELSFLETICEKVYVVFVCVESRQICCITVGDFYEWLAKRKEALGKDEDASTILVSLPEEKSFRVNMNQPNRRKVYLAKPQIVSRNQFPNALFEK